jgi:hypothetical protein
MDPHFISLHDLALFALNNVLTLTRNEANFNFIFSHIVRLDDSAFTLKVCFAPPPPLNAATLLAALL